jgi:hypothetical protein
MVVLPAMDFELSINTNTDTHTHTLQTVVLIYLLSLLVGGNAT